MAALIDYYFSRKNIEAMLAAADDKGLAVTIRIGDDTNQYGKNVSAWKSQTKEQRDARELKAYYGGGKVVWHDGSISCAKKVDGATQEERPTPETFEPNFNVPF